MQPFEIHFDPDDISDLKSRIRRTRWPVLPFDRGWERGTDLGTLQELAAYWAEEYDVDRAVAELNKLTHLRGPIEGEQLHCVVAKGRGAAPRLPLLLVHGWPGSFLEFLDAAALLAAPDETGASFDVIVPSLPGFAFSDAPRRPGTHEGAIATRLHALMRELGYERYGVQGGDWGGVIGTALALQQPDAVVGLHLNFSSGALPAPDGEEPSEAEREYLAFREQWNADELGYYWMQSTRPQTLAYALHDSPVGLLAWILEKFWAWSDHSDDLWTTLDRDRVLTNVMLYWLPARVLSAASLYYEAEHADGTFLDGRVEVPTAYLRSPREPWRAPRDMVARKWNLVRYTELPSGGHFAAMEQPLRFAADVRAFFASPEVLGPMAEEG